MAGISEIFFSYAHEDEQWRQELEKHLSMLKRSGLITGWHDRQILAGNEWVQQTDTHLNSAHLILLLISPDFIASEYCWGVEVQRAMERHYAGEARVIPILIRPVDWQGAQFGTLQALPTNNKPVISWTNPDEAFLQVAQGIRKAVEELHRQRSAKPSSSFPIWNVPYDRNLLFTGREEVLKRLHEALGAGNTTILTQPQAISGLGGIGKTQTAVEYAYRYQNDYDTILWVKGDSSESLMADVVTIAHLLHLPEMHEQNQHLIVEAVKHWLRSHARWLLIFDNADDLTMTKPFLPSGGKGHILLTTRTQFTGTVAQRVELEVMNEEEGASFLLHRAAILAYGVPLDAATRSDQAAAREIVQVLGGLPLALDQAGAYIEETRCSLLDYLRLYHTRQAELLRRRGRLTADHPDSVAITWSLSFEKVEQANPAAADLLRLCVFLDPDIIPEEIIAKGASELGSVLQSIASEPIKLNETISDLLAYSLMRRNPDATLTIHRLVQAVLKHGMKKNVQRRWAERAVRAVYHAFPAVNYDTWLHCEQYLPHVQVCAVLIDQWEMVFPEATDLLLEAGYYLQERGRYTEAEPFYQKALSIQEQVLGPEHLDTATILDRLAALYKDWGQYEQAKSLYQRAFVIYEREMGSEHAFTGIALGNLALLDYLQGRYEQAEPLYLRALAIKEQELGPEHPGTAITLNNLASLYYDQGRYAEAEQLLQRALAIEERVLGPEHPETATTLNNLAKLYQVQEQYKQAEQFFQRALAIEERVLGPERPSIAITLDNLAGLDQTQGQYEQAEPLYLRALAIKERELGPEHPETAITLNNLALLYKDQGRYEQAEPLFQRALAIDERVLGPEHPETATTLNNLALLYMDQGQYEQAEQFFQRALAIDERVLGPEHPKTAIDLDNLALLYMDQGRYEQAKLLYQRVLAIYKKALGTQHSSATVARKNYTKLLRKMKRKAVATTWQDKDEQQK